MKIGIVGHGYVGKSVEIGFNGHHTILISDPKENSVTIDNLIQSECTAIFICVPTPTVDGKQDDSIVKSCIRQLQNYNGLVILKSTVLPSNISKLLNYFPNLIICPEFLREKSFEWDAINPNIIVVGVNKKNEYDKFFWLLNDSNINAQNVVWVKPETAAYFKYFVNSFLAMKVLFVHEFVKNLEDKTVWGQMKPLFELEGRIGDSHLNAPGDHGWGFSGTCFPKDTEALLQQLPEFNLLEQVIKLNKELRNETSK